MKRLGVPLALVALAFPSAAAAQAPGFHELPQGLVPAGPTPGSQQGLRQGGDVPSRSQPGRGRSLVRRCSTRARVRRCRTYRANRLIRVCTKRPGRAERCRRVRGRASAAATDLGPPARMSAMRTHGFQSPVLPAVGRFYYDGANASANYGWCSGTMLFSGIVLTAAHCLFDQKSGRYLAPSQLRFVPGNASDGVRPVSNHGTWQVVNAFAHGAYQQGADVDWGLAVLAPDATGRYAGDYTGTFPSFGGVYLQAGNAIARMGYPAEGPWATAALFRGAGQYFCNETISDVQRDGIGLHWLVFANRCPMNGGSSGGPNFVQFQDGSWGIVGVNNRGCGPCDRAPYRGGWGERAYNIWFDQGYVSFVDSVISYLNGQTARAARERTVSPSGHRER